MRSAQEILLPYFCLIGQSRRRALSRFALSGQLLMGAKRCVPVEAPPLRGIANGRVLLGSLPADGNLEQRPPAGCEHARLRNAELTSRQGSINISGSEGALLADQKHDLHHTDTEQLQKCTYFFDDIG